MNEPRLLDVQRIWDHAPHNAFTDLILHKETWYCVFREGQGHVSDDGKLRVIRSRDGKTWASAALITSAIGDLRDAKLTVTPDGGLMLSGAVVPVVPGQPREQYALQSMVWFSADGTDWSEGVDIGDPNFWLWRTTWHKNLAYAVGYGCRSEQGTLRLYVSADGRTFTPHVKCLLNTDYPNETSLLFIDDVATCLLRRDAGTCTAFLGLAQPPYTDWQWKDLGVRIGGPHMARIPDGRLFAAVRLYDDPVRTSLCLLDPDASTLTESLKLPSGGDTSYAGMVWHADTLWIAYYSSHEEKTCIYLARVGF